MNNANIEPGVYRHYKGRYYFVIGMGKLEENLAEVVIYQPLYEGSPAEYWVRPVAEFCEQIQLDNGKKYRYELIEKAQDKMQKDDIIRVYEKYFNQ